MTHTKAELLERDDRITKQNTLYMLYLHDTQTGVLPIVVRKGTIRINLYRPESASGGYCVFLDRDGESVNTWIMYFEEAQRIQANDNNLDLRIVIERARIEASRY